MLPARHRLTSRREISETVRRGVRARRGGIVVHVLHTPSPRPPRAAFTVSKSVGDSVTRHRVVRRLRAQIAELLDRLPAGTNVVVRAMPESAQESSREIHGDLIRALDKLVALAPDEEYIQPSAVPTATTGSAAADDRSVLGRVTWCIGWPLRALLLGLIWVYRHTISPILPPTCRYHPSCSAYGFEALRVHGAFKGTVLAGWRVLRCNPFSGGGLDPVPDRGHWHPSINPDGTPRAPAGGLA